MLRTLALGAQHGHGIATAIRNRSGDSIFVNHGSLYPALRRLQQNRRIEAAWGISGNNRRARFFKITRAGRIQLAAETRRWRNLVTSIERVIGDP